MPEAMEAWTPLVLSLGNHYPRFFQYADKATIYFHCVYMHGTVFIRKKPCLRVAGKADCKAVSHKELCQALVHGDDPGLSVFAVFNDKYPSI